MRDPQEVRDCVGGDGGRKLTLSFRRVGALDEPIARLKKDYALVRSGSFRSRRFTDGDAPSQVTKTLRTALELPDEEPKSVT